MPDLLVVLDPTAEGTGTELTYASLGDLIEHSAPHAPLTTIAASSVDTEGDIPAELKYGTGEIVDKLVVRDTTAAGVQTKLDNLFEKLGKIQREGGTYKRTSVDGTVRIYDLLREVEGGLTWDVAYLAGNAATVDIRYTRKPFWRGTEVGNLTDDFSTDTIGSGLWAFDEGSGTVSVSGGQLVPSTTSTKRMYRADREFYDGQVTAKHTTPSPTTGYEFAVSAKRIDGSNYLFAHVSPTLMSIYKRDGGANTSLASVAITALAISTSYWLRLRIEGNKITAEHFTADPAGATPANTATHTLVGADATKFGLGIQGEAGIGWWSPGTTAARADDFSVAPNVYSETTLPALILVGPGPTGEVSALGRLVVTDTQAVDLWQVDVGVQSRYYSSAATAALRYPATDLTPVGTSTDTGTVIRNTDLIPTWQAILRSEIDATNAALTHNGNFRLKVRLSRPTGNTGAVAIRLEWGEGDYHTITLNDPVYYDVDDREGVDVWADLGLVHIPATSVQWEFRILARSTVVGDEIDIKDVLLFPTTEGYIELAARRSFEIPSTFSARDEFDQTAGTLAGKTAPVGGIWAAIGDTDVLSVETTGKTAQRTAVNDSLPVGRVDSLPVALTNVAVQVDFKSSIASPASAGDVQLGVAARVDRVSSDFFRASYWTLTGALIVHKVVGGVVSQVRSLDTVNIAAGAWHTIRLLVTATGMWYVWLFPQGSQLGVPLLSGIESDLATGGTLATGEVGISDRSLDATAVTRNYDNFFAFVPALDAATFASQSLELRYDRATRENAAGTISGIPISQRRGRYLRIPPAGQENRSVRIIVKGYRTDPITMSEPTTNDDISAQLFVTPRGL